MSELPPTTTTEPASEALSRPAPLHWRRVLVTTVACLACLLGAGALARYLAGSRGEHHAPERARPRTGVRVIVTREREVQPEIRCLGRSRPARVVTVSAQVAGLAVEVHQGLEDGVVLEAGELAVRIDPTDHQHAVDRRTAQVAAARAEQERLEAQRSHQDERIRVLQELVELEKEEERRTAGLLERGLGSERDADVARLSHLRNQDSLLSLQMTRDLLEPQLAAAVAQVQAAATDLATAQVSLDRTTIRIPFRGLVAHVAAEEHQLITAGQVLFELWQVDRLEVPAVLTLEEAGLLASGAGAGANGATPPVEVTVQYRGCGGPSLEWPGTLLRLEPVDPADQTVRAVVGVAGDAGRPVLLPGVLCEVLLRAPPRAMTVIPLEALQERSRVYAVRDGRLAVLPVVVGPRLNRFIQILAGLRPEEQVIISPIEKPLEGLELEVLPVEGEGS